MSFSSDVKEELEKVIPESRHCQLAELAAIIHFGCKIKEDGKTQDEINISSENLFAFRKYFTLLKKTFIINVDVVRILQAVKVCDESGHLYPLSDEVNPLLIKNSCCRRAFLRGAFL